MQLGSKYIRFAVTLATMVLLCTIGYGMEEGVPYRYSLDTIKTKIENLSATPADTTGRASQAADTASTDTLVNNSSLEEPIFSGGRDSIVKDFDVDGRKMIYYYGDVKVSYGDLELSADYMAFDVDSKTVFAKGLPDTSGQVIGKPVMKQGDKQYEMESVYYNFNTEKAKIKNMIAVVDDCGRNRRSVQRFKLCKALQDYAHRNLTGADYGNRLVEVGNYCT